MSEQYDVIGSIGREDLDDPGELAARLNKAGLSLLAEYDDNDPHPYWMIAKQDEEPTQ